MSNVSARPLVALLTAALLAFAVSCGGGDDAAPSGPTAAPATASPLVGDQVLITYFGHSMFTIETPGGVTILTDPNEGMGYAAPSGEIDVVTVSHDHFDHSKTGLAPDARVIRGLTDDGDWAEVDETIGDVRIQSAPSFHDDREGAERGKNAIFSFRIGALNIVHAGDIGHNPIDMAVQEPAVLGLIMDADVLLLPVGGHFTIGPGEADSVIASLNPTLVIPMHYRTDFLRDFPNADDLATVDDFTAGKVNVLRPRQSNVAVAAGPQEPTAIMVLEPQPE